MMQQNWLPPFRAWHPETGKMYDVDSITFITPAQKYFIRGVSKDGNVVGFVEDFVVMRQSSITDVVGNKIFAGDIVVLDGVHSKYPNELFAICDFEDCLYVNKMGINIPLMTAISTHGAKVVGNIFENPTLFAEMTGAV